MAHIGSIRSEELRRLAAAGKARLGISPPRQASGAIVALIDEAIRLEREHWKTILERELREAEVQARDLRQALAESTNRERNLSVRLRAITGRRDYWHHRAMALLRVTEDQGRLLDASEPVGIGRVS